MLGVVRYLYPAVQGQQHTRCFMEKNKLNTHLFINLVSCMFLIQSLKHCVFLFITVFINSLVRKSVQARLAIMSQTTYYEVLIGSKQATAVNCLNTYLCQWMSCIYFNISKVMLGPMWQLIKKKWLHIWENTMFINKKYQALTVLKTVAVNDHNSRFVFWGTY